MTEKEVLAALFKSIRDLKEADEKGIPGVKKELSDECLMYAVVYCKMLTNLRGWSEAKALAMLGMQLQGGML